MCLDRLWVWVIFWVGEYWFMVRCFIAVEVSDPGVVSEVSRVQDVLQATGAPLRCVDPSCLHLTLRFLGEVDGGTVQRVGEAVRGIGFPGFQVAFQGVGCFPGLRRPRTVWAGVSQGSEELVEVYRKVEGALEGLGFRPEGRGFHPHLTLCRVKGGGRRGELVSALLELADHWFGVERVEAVKLFSSRLTPRGPIYTELASSSGEV